jgi:hypothetical protein
MMPGSGNRRQHADQHAVLSAYPLTPVSPSRGTPNGHDDPGRNNSQEMSRSPNDGTSRLTSPHSSTRRSRLHTRIPLPSDVFIDPGSPVSERAAELIHEFVHPHHHYHSGENLLETDEELDEADDKASIIAREFEEMQSRVWWRRPSALWYAPAIRHSSQSLVIRNIQC